MKVEGADKLRRQLAALGGGAHEAIVRAVRRNTEQMASVARALAPDVTGETRAAIDTQYADGGLTGVVEAVDPDAERREKDKRYSIEHGRKKGKRGRTEGYHFMHRTRQTLGPKARRSIRSAVSRAVRKAAKGG